MTIWSRIDWWCLRSKPLSQCILILETSLCHSWLTWSSWWWSTHPRTCTSSLCLWSIWLLKILKLQILSRWLRCTVSLWIKPTSNKTINLQLHSKSLWLKNWRKETVIRFPKIKLLILFGHCATLVTSLDCQGRHWSSEPYKCCLSSIVPFLSMRENFAKCISFTCLSETHTLRKSCTRTSRESSPRSKQSWRHMLTLNSMNRWSTLRSKLISVANSLSSEWPLLSTHKHIPLAVRTKLTSSWLVISPTPCSCLKALNIPTLTLKSGWPCTSSSMSKLSILRPQGRDVHQAPWIKAVC